MITRLYRFACFQNQVKKIFTVTDEYLKLFTSHSAVLPRSLTVRLRADRAKYLCLKRVFLHTFSVARPFEERSNCNQLSSAPSRLKLFIMKVACACNVETVFSYKFYKLKITKHIFAASKCIERKYAMVWA